VFTSSITALNMEAPLIMSIPTFRTTTVNTKQQ